MAARTRGTNTFLLFALLAGVGLCYGALQGCQRTSSADQPHTATKDREQRAAPPAEPKGPPVLLDPAKPLNVLLILIDGLHDQMPWMGYERDIAPWLTAFERRSVSYMRAYSIASSTARSVGPLLAGRYPSEMYRNGYYFTVYEQENVFIGEHVQKAGHHTLSAHSHAYFNPETGIAQGFTDFRLLEGTTLNNMRKDNVTSERMTELAKEMLSDPRVGKDDSLFFAYFHYMDPHAPYLPHDDRKAWGKTTRDFYDQEVHFTDEWVGKLVDWALEQPWGDNTAVIISADHGESFGEHNLYKHGYELWEDVIHVPLLIYAPGSAARRIHTPRSHIDLAPTILELMGLRPELPLPGVSLVPELYGLPPKPRPVVADLPRDNLQDRRRAVIDGDTKLIAQGDDASFLLFDLTEDPEELNDIFLSEPRRARHMLKLYEEVSSSIGQAEVVGYANLKGAPPGRRW